MTWTSPHAVDVVASPSHGLLMWTPLVVLAVAGLALLYARLDRSHRPVAIALAVMAVVQVYIAGSVESWTVAGAFGQRRFVALTVILVVGLAALLTAAGGPGASRRWRAAPIVAVAVAAACWWNVGLMAQFGSGMMNRQRLEPARIAYNTFVVMPRVLPDLAWRYFSDRASFYESARRLRGR